MTAEKKRKPKRHWFFFFRIKLDQGQEHTWCVDFYNLIGNGWSIFVFSFLHINAIGMSLTNLTTIIGFLRQIMHV